MTQARGSNSPFLIDFETAFGVSPTTVNGLQMPINTETLKGKENTIDPSTITGSRNAVEPARGNLDVAGGATVPVDLNAFAYWLKACFNSPVTTGASAPYTHKFKIPATQPSIVVAKQFGNGQCYQYNGVKVDSLKMSFGGDGELTADLDFVGAKETIGTTLYDSSPTPIVLERLGNFQASFEIDGVASTVAKQLDFTINFGLEKDGYTIGSNGERTSIAEGMTNISGSMKALFEDGTLVAKAVSGAKVSLKMKLTSGTKSLEFLFPEVKLERQAPSISGPAGIVLDMSWKAFYANDANNSSVVVTLINGLSTI